MLAWSTTSQVAMAKGIKVLVYGEAGFGKTCLCVTAPRPVILSAESGLLSLTRRNLERLYGVGNPNVSYDTPVITIANLQDLYAAYNMFADPAQRMREHVSTICLDSLTEIAEQVLSAAKAGNKDIRQAYGDLIERMVVLVKAFRDLDGYNVVMTAKIEYVKDDMLGGMKYSVNMPGQKVGPALPYLFDEVFCLRMGMHEGKQYRYLMTQGDTQYVAKDRSGALDAVDKPDLTYLFNKISGA